MLKNVTDITSQGKQTGLNTQENILAIDKSQSPDMMNVIANFDGSLEKRLGSNTQNAVIIANSAAAGFSPTGGITNNLIAFWRMDEPSGNRSDAFGGNTLLDNNGVLSDGGIKNKAALFVAANTSYLLCNNTSTLSTGDINFSFSAWFYLNSTSLTTERTILSKKDVGGPYGGIDSSTVLLLHCDGINGSQVFTDNSLAPHVMTASGNVQQSTSQKKFGSASAAFDGAGDYIQTPNVGLDWNFGTGDFTIESQFYLNLSDGTAAGIVGTGFNNGWFLVFNDPAQLVFYVTGTGNTGNWSPLLNTWYHLAAVRSSSVLKLYVNGSSILSIANAGNITGNTGNLFVGWDAQADATFQMGSGFLDEVRVSKTARWSTDFVAPTIAYGAGNEFEYMLYVNTDQILTFRVSSSGTTQNGSVRATSFGALNTATWYNAIAYHDTADLLAVGVNLSMNSAAYTLGVRAGSAPFVVGSVSNGAEAFFDGRIDEVGFWKKILDTTDRTNLYNAGSANTYQNAFDNKPWASFDFGASAIRWLTVAAGTGVYASSNLGVTWVNIASDRSATYQYFERSKNALVATSDLYDTPLAWTGSANTFMVGLNSNAPLCKYSINFQGFLILLNSNTRKRGFFYQDENTQLTGTWASSFDIPSSQDDEITATFIFRKNLYISTRYYLYRISYVGGNPDFSFEKVKDWGFVPRTVKQIYVAGVGQVVKGLCWDRKTRLFDGSDDQISSDNIEDDNSLCVFSLNNISYSGSGPVVSFAETDYNQNVYKLCVAIGQDSMQTTHMINYDGRSKSFYPFNRQHFNTMVMAESANQRFLMAFDRSGYCHMLNSGNLDGNTTAVDDHFDCSLIFDKSPAQSQKGHQTNLFFSNTTCGRLFYLDRTDFDSDYDLRESFVISGSDKKFHIHKVIDVTESYNTYQWRLTSSAGTSTPWKLQRYDHLLKGQGIGRE